MNRKGKTRRVNQILKDAAREGGGGVGEHSPLDYIKAESGVGPVSTFLRVVKYICYKTYIL